MKSTTTLPENYRLSGTLDLSKNQKAVLLLNLVGLGLFILFGWLLLRASISLRPAMANALFSFSVDNALQFVVWLAVLLASTVVMVLLHEGVHGLFFWLATGARPKFGFRGAYAYACAPDWYLPRGPYLWISLSPLVVLTLLGLALVRVLPLSVLPVLLLLMVLNASGAVGDLAVFFWLLGKPAGSLANDRGDAVSLYTPVK